MFQPPCAVRSLSLLLILLLTGCGSVEADLETGKQARRAGDVALASRHLEPLADFGIDEAKYELALTLLKEKDASAENLNKARTLLQGVQGDKRSVALFEVARLYERGLGIDKDLNAAKDYYKQSGDLGYARGHFQLASLLEKEKDFVNAEGLYKHAFYNQYDRASMNLGRLYEKGQTKDVVKALAWYIVAQRRSVPGADEKVRELSALLGSQEASQSAQISIGLEENEKK